MRLPAAANGVYGLTPTYGRVSRYGVMPRAWSLDTVGPLTRTALDCARMTRVIAGYDPNDGTSRREPVSNYESAARRGVDGLRIGIPADYFYDTVTGDVKQALDQSLRVLRSLGARIVRVKVPDPAPYYRLNDLVMRCESAAFHGKWLREWPEDYSEYVRARLEAGLHIPATRYIEALTLRGKALADFLDSVMRKIDTLHCPVIPFPVPTLEEMDPSGADPETLEKTARLPGLTRIFNYLGVPSLNVPCGFAANGLPVSFQVVARPFNEAVLFTVAHAYQGVTDWHRQVPPA